MNLAVRDGISTRTLERIYAGLRNAAREASTDIVGGNITRARELSITIAMHRRGQAPCCDAMLRVPATKSS